MREPVDPSHAPRPTNDAERLLFRQLYPTLIRLDCQDSIRANLAGRWSLDSSEHTWTLVLREGARLPGGSPVTTAGLVSGWQARWSLLQDLGIDSVRALDEQRVVVRVTDLRDESLRLFADPALSAGSSDRSATAGGITLSLAAGPVIELRTSPEGDLRDALDRRADLVVTQDLSIIEYAARRAEFEIFPLPWSLTYTLVQPAGATPIAGPIYDDGFRRSLAQDAVRADARAAQPRAWWNGPCSTETPMEAASPTASRVVYSRGDEVARQVAERIIAVTPDSAQLTAAALDPTQFAQARHNGKDRAYIVAVPLRPLLPCREAADLTRRDRVTPLIDTRSRAIVRRGSPGLTVDWDGTVRVVPDAGSEPVEP